MDFIKICGVTVLSLVLTWVLKQRDNKFASLVTIFTVISISIYTITALIPIIELTQNISLSTRDGSKVIGILLKASGIQMFAQIFTALCNESGERSLATIIERAADVAILSLSIPLLQDVFKTVSELLNNT